MDLLDVQPKQFIFHYGITHTDLLMFKIILDHMQFNYDSAVPEHIAAKEYLETRLYPSVIDGLKSVEGSNG